MLQTLSNLFKTKPKVDAVPRADDGLPFHARIGSQISFQYSPFLGAEVNNSFLKNSDADGGTIVSISRLKVRWSDIDMYRFYLARGDDGDPDDRETFLQVVVKDKEVTEAIFYKSIARIFPEDQGMLDAYLGENESGLGELQYDLWDQTLPEQLRYAFKDGADEITYRRDTGDEEFLKPFEARETRIDDATGNQGLEQSTVFMPYYRPLTSEQSEMLLISTEILKTEDGNPKKAVHVDFMAGILLDKSRFTII